VSSGKRRDREVCREPCILDATVLHHRHRCGDLLHIQDLGPFGFDSDQDDFGSVMDGVQEDRQGSCRHSPLSTPRILVITQSWDILELVVVFLGATSGMVLGLFGLCAVAGTSILDVSKEPSVGERDDLLAIFATPARTSGNCMQPHADSRRTVMTR